MGSPWYKIMLGMSYYIHAGGLGALKALPGSVSKRVTPVAVIVLPGRRLTRNSKPGPDESPPEGGLGGPAAALCWKEH